MPSKRRIRAGEAGLVSVTVSYLRKDGQLALSRIGEGGDLAAAIADADRQLYPGRWRRLCVSTPATIEADLQGRSGRRRRSSGPRSFEGKTVSVREPREVRR